jgi:hypothetical protein
MILTTLRSLAESRPELLSGHERCFFVFESDPWFVKELKLDILGVVVGEAGVGSVLSELKVDHRFCYVFFEMD